MDPEDRIRRRIRSHAVSLAMVMIAGSVAVWAYNHPPEQAPALEVVTTEFADSSPPFGMKMNSRPQADAMRAARIKEHIRKGEYQPADFAKEFADRPELERLVKD